MSLTFDLLTRGSYQDLIAERTFEQEVVARMSRDSFAAGMIQ